MLLAGEKLTPAIKVRLPPCPFVVLKSIALAVIAPVERIARDCPLKVSVPTLKVPVPVLVNVPAPALILALVAVTEPAIVN